MAYGQFLLICLIWGSSFILMKKAALCFAPATVGAWRLIGGALFLAVVWWSRGHRRSLGADDLRPLLFVIGIGYCWPFTVQPWLVTQVGSAFIGMIVTFTPLLTIVVSIPLLGIWPTRRQIAGVLGALVCMVGLMLDGLNRNVSLIQLALAVTVPFSYALANTVIRRRLRKAATLDLTCFSLAGAACVLLPLSWLIPLEPPSNGGSLVVAVVSLVLLGVVGTGVAVMLFNRLVQQHGPLFAGMVTNLVPVGALLWGWLDGEQVTSLQLAALAGVVAMVTLVQYGAAGRVHTEGAPAAVDDERAAV